jgi:ssDNA-binding Zn-finger/Zn-ribbon topoisomerase 1
MRQVTGTKPGQDQVDQVLYSVCKALGSDHPAMAEGKIVRLGTLKDDKLIADYAGFVSVDGIIERLSVELKERKEEIEEEVKELIESSAKAKSILKEFEVLDQAKNDANLLSKELEAARAKENGLTADLNRNAQNAAKLETELKQRDGALFKVFKRSEISINRDINSAKVSRQSISKHFETAQSNTFASQKRLNECISKFKSMEISLRTEDRNVVEVVVKEADKNNATLLSELREIERNIADIRDEILKNAMVLGATCTKSYLSSKDIGRFDFVIIDEASMVLPAMVWFTAGLSKERVVICGDFRQIPPIVQTNQQAIFDVLGKDVFEKTGISENPVNDDRLAVLTDQYRMNDQICSLISEPMYQNQLCTAESRVSTEERALPDPFSNRLTIVDTSDLWPFESVNAFFSRYNLMHALLVRNLTWHLHQEGYIRDEKDLAVCTPYAAQSKLIRKLIEPEEFSSNVQVGTVHSFQGDERHSIILEIPESHGGGRMLGQFVQGVAPNFVGARLMNVAVSRAQENLIVLANLTHLDKFLPSTALLREILCKMQDQGQIISGQTILEKRPIKTDLAGLVGRIPVNVDVEKTGVFDQTEFDAAFYSDLQNAKESIVIFSGFVTPSRVREIGERLRLKISEGVNIRCVTRPPKTNGSMSPEITIQALDMLEGIGCVVDLRAQIHQKVIIIDKTIVWHGSLNALSTNHRTDEVMTRLSNGGFAETVATNISKQRVSGSRAIQSLLDAENPRCLDCGGRSYYSDSKYGPYFTCEHECGWKINLKSLGKQNAKRKKGSENPDLPNEGPPCPKHDVPMTLKSGKFGPFYGCVKYPDCSETINAGPKPKSKRRSRSKAP